MRAIFIVMDSSGVGELPDAGAFGDKGSNTIGHIVQKYPDIKIDNLIDMGLGSIDGIEYIKASSNVIGCYGKMAEKSNGKDTTVGHWELAGVVTEDPFPTYPNGFPDEILNVFEKEIEKKVIGNCVASGTAIIEKFGEEHVKTGRPILYTSADSVFQIAAHEDIISIEELYKMCEFARKILVGKHKVARVIARPFLGDIGEFYRTKNRKDFSVEPTSDTMLNLIEKAGQTVDCVGKIEDIFCGSGVTHSVHTKNNMDGVDKTLQYMDNVKEGLIFTNLVDFDMTFGHRRDVEGYKNALEEFDKRIPEIYSKLNDDDIFIISADHGCDPTMKGSDHTREYVPVLVYGKSFKSGVNLSVRTSFCDIASTILEFLKIENKIQGNSFLSDISN